MQGLVNSGRRLARPPLSSQDMRAMGFARCVRSGAYNYIYYNTNAPLSAKCVYIIFVHGGVAMLFSCVLFFVVVLFVLCRIVGLGTQVDTKSMANGGIIQEGP